MVIKPDYYENFKCIAGKCRHSCCIGWEIDIDTEATQKYNLTTGIIGDKLQKCISKEPCAHFILGENERCPFLNGENLCELIIFGGEDMLCQICKDHPRFFNEFEGITEVGLGLCCEAAAEIILSAKSPFTLLSDNENPPESEFYYERAEAFAVLQNRSAPLANRISSLLKWAKAENPLCYTGWPSFYKGLERLDPAWEELLLSAKPLSDEIPKALEIPAEQLLCYFIFRHLSGALQDFLFAERVQFAVLSTYIILSCCKSPNLDILLDTARAYSSEIEYSDENVELILEKLQEINWGGI